MKELTKVFGKRKQDYETLLKYHQHELTPIQLAEVQGAMKEIDIFLQALEFSMEQRRGEAMEPERMVQTRPDILTKISMLFKH